MLGHLVTALKRNWKPDLNLICIEMRSFIPWAMMMNFEIKSIVIMTTLNEFGNFLFGRLFHLTEPQN